MVAMIHVLRFIALGALIAVPAFGQVPPGFPYDAAKHSNPIVTYVDKTDFRPSNYNDAVDAADIELLGLSSEEGQRESI